MKSERYTLSNETLNSQKTSTSIEGQYQKLEQDRESYLERAREGATLTIPYLYPEKGSNENTQYSTPYQSIGSRGVLNLASK